jgi:hypothetical protein
LAASEAIVWAGRVVRFPSAATFATGAGDFAVRDFAGVDFAAFAASAFRATARAFALAIHDLVGRALPRVEADAGLGAPVAVREDRGAPHLGV